jgi:hypothetical protein
MLVIFVRIRYNRHCFYEMFDSTWLQRGICHYFPSVQNSPQRGLVQCSALLVDPASARDLCLRLVLLDVPNYTNGNLHRNSWITCLLLCYCWGLALSLSRKHWRPEVCQEYCDDSILVVSASSDVSTVMFVCVQALCVCVHVCIYAYECVFMYVYMNMCLCRVYVIHVIMHVCIRQIYTKNCTMIT